MYEGDMSSLFLYFSVQPFETMDEVVDIEVEESYVSFTEWISTWDDKHKFSTGAMDREDGSGTANCGKCGKSYKFNPNKTREGKRRHGFCTGNALKHYNECKGNIQLSMPIPVATNPAPITGAVSFKMTDNEEDLSPLNQLVIMKSIEPNTAPVTTHNNNSFLSAMHALIDFKDKGLELTIIDDEIVFKCKTCIGRRGERKGERWSLDCSKNTQ